MSGSVRWSRRSGATITSITSWSHADAILVLCSHDTVVAARGAELFLGGWAPLLIFSGGLGGITRRIWREPEADQFARIAVAMGVPPERILIENQSTNTGENVRFTRRLSPSGASIRADVHRRAEAVHGAPQLCDVQESVAGEGPAA